jgi:phage-related protein
MPSIEIFFYREDDGTVPLIRWLAGLPAKARDKCIAYIGMLRDLGNELRRPQADYLDDGIFELRATRRGIHYRMLYFFHGPGVAVISHGIIKKDKVPGSEIRLAAERKELVESDPERYIHRPGPQE